MDALCQSLCDTLPLDDVQEDLDTICPTISGTLRDIACADQDEPCEVKCLNATCNMLSTPNVCGEFCSSQDMIGLENKYAQDVCDKGMILPKGLCDMLPITQDTCGAYCDAALDFLESQSKPSANQSCWRESPDLNFEDASLWTWPMILVSTTTGGPQCLLTNM